jgi:predicted glycosyltransferase
MMDYEHQPANHVSFRLASRVIVPEVFPESSLRTQGARSAKITRYKGFKEELYLAGFEPDTKVLDELSLDRERLLAVFRPPPAGALYHRSINERFDDLLGETAHRKDVQVVLLPRSHEQADLYRRVRRVVIPDRVIDTCSLMALADVVIGAGGTMNREAALLGTPTYTVFAGKLAAVDAELIRLGLLHDLRPIDAQLTLARRRVARRRATAERAASIVAVVAEVVEGLAARQSTRLEHVAPGGAGALATSSTSSPPVFRRRDSAP